MCNVKQSSRQQPSTTNNHQQQPPPPPTTINNNNQQYGRLLNNVETYLRLNARESPDLWRPRGRAPPTYHGRPGHGGAGGSQAEQQEEPPRVDYVADARLMEPMFDAFLEEARARMPYEAEDPHHSWHRRCAVVVVNPSKPRANPRGSQADLGHKAPNFVEQWTK